MNISDSTMFAPYNATGGFGDFEGTFEDQFNAPTMLPAQSEEDVQQQEEGGTLFDQQDDGRAFQARRPDTPISKFPTRVDASADEGGDAEELMPSPPSSSSNTARVLHQQRLQQQQLQQQRARQMRIPHTQRNIQHTNARNGKSKHQEAFEEEENEAEQDDVASLTPQQRMQLRQMMLAAYAKEPSLWSKVWSKRRDMLKLLVLACVVVLALGTHSAVMHYVATYIQESEIESWYTELAIRVGYPIAIFVVMWLLKLAVSPPPVKQ